MDKDTQESIALQLGVLMQALSVVIQHMGMTSPIFRQDIQQKLRKFADLQQARPYQDDNVALVSEMIETLLHVLPEK
mgnify:CR=1 FL=1